MKPEKRLELEQKSLERVVYWIGNSDTKIQIVLAFVAALPALLISQYSDIKFLITTSILFVAWFIVFLMLFHFYFLSTCLLFAFRTIAPDVKPRNQGSLFFFGTIALMSVVKYKQKMLSITPEEAENQINEQTHTVFTIASAKFSNLQESLKRLILALGAWLVIFLVLIIGKLL